MREFTNGRLPFLFMQRFLLFLLALLGASLAVRAEVPNIVFITVDTTRSDRMGFMGNAHGLTPHLDLVAGQGIVFERAYSQAPLTPVSHATIFTATYPQFHTVTDFGHPLPTLLPYLPEILQKAGYKTAAFIGSLILDPRASMAPGFDRGFAYFDAGFRAKADPDEDRYSTIERRGGDVVSHAIRWLNGNSKSPFFVWVHLYDPHAPYEPPSPYDKRFKDPYDGEIAYADACLGKLFSYLRQHGLYENTMIVMMSDHGESLGAHGESMHGIFLYDETIHVPLIMKLPRELLARHRVSARVRLVDVAPTLLSMLSLPLPPTFQGESLVPLMKGDAKGAKDLPAYAETDYPHRAFGWSALRSLRSGKYLFVRSPKRELYDESRDKDAGHNLAESSPAVATTLLAQIDELHDKTAIVSDKAQPTQLTGDQADNLSALGYVASTAGGQSQDVFEGADPKDKIGISNILHKGMIAVEDGRYADAIPLLQEVLADSPLVTAAQLQLGIALAKTKRYKEAIGALRKSVEQIPDSVQAQYELGLALFETGSLRDSVPYFEFVAKKRPKWADAQFSLAAVYARTQHVPEAVDLLHSVVELYPQHFRANLLLGRILTLQNHAADAVPYLKQAVSSEPRNFEPHAFLADALDQLGEKESAGAERARAQALKEGAKHD